MCMNERYGFIPGFLPPIELSEEQMRRAIRREVEIYENSRAHAGVYLGAWLTREPKIAHEEIPPDIIVALILDGYAD